MPSHVAALRGEAAAGSRAWRNVQQICRRLEGQGCVCQSCHQNVQQGWICGKGVPPVQANSRPLVSSVQPNEGAARPHPAGVLGAEGGMVHLVGQNGDAGPLHEQGQSHLPVSHVFEYGSILLSNS